MLASKVFYRQTLSVCACPCSASVTILECKLSFVLRNEACFASIAQSTAKDIAPHADAMRLPTPARAVQIPVVQSSTAITALSPVCRTRVILPTDRSPKASPVLRGFGFPQTVVRKAPEVAKAEAKPEAVQLLQPEVAKEAAATKSVDAPKEPLSVPSDGTAKEEQKEINEAAKESKLDVQTGQGEHRDSPDLLGDFRSQTSTQASEVKCESPQIAGVPVLEEEVRSVRPLPPRPQHAPDLREVCPGRKQEAILRVLGSVLCDSVFFSSREWKALPKSEWCPFVKVGRTC